jgi:hypothetical protein
VDLQELLRLHMTLRAAGAGENAVVQALVVEQPQPHGRRELELQTLFEHGRRQRQRAPLRVPTPDDRRVLARRREPHIDAELRPQNTHELVTVDA